MTATLSDRINQVLADRGWTQADLARRANTTTATAANWATKKVNPEHVKALMLFNIAEALEVDPRWLLLGDSAQYRITEGSIPAYSGLDIPALEAAIEDAITTGVRNERSPTPPLLAQMISILYGHYTGRDSDGRAPVEKLLSGSKTLV
ncbi:MAG: helix-turn-helix domain-containing protein [Proteobacteria bacterium]|nr:helix-turn-helix domain-containing protein [Pseudomonadota bacterium]